MEKQILSASNGVRLWVPGRPRTKGSLEPRHKPGYRGTKCKVWLTESGELSEPWKRHMMALIREQAQCTRYAGPVEVHAFFRFEPGSADEQWDSHIDWPTGRQYGDEDKLRRNLLDALTQSALLADDSLVVGGQTWKRFVEFGEQPGVALAVLPARPVSDVIELEWAMVGRRG